jgi:protoporphyrinogen/coproporphyrinogen III oxidase
MTSTEVIVVGGGLSGLAFAHASAAAGRQALVLEQQPRLGGCIDTRRLDSGYWFELGAHTAYNSYGGFIDLIEACQLRDKLVARASVPFRMLRSGELRSVLKELSLVELLLNLPRALTAKKDGLTVAGYYSRLVGKDNFRRMLSPFLSAVPSQNADDFPSTMLFKSRPRRKDILRSFTLAGGLSTVIDGIGRRPGISTEIGVDVAKIRRSKDGFVVSSADGREWASTVVAVAVPPPMAAAVLRSDFPQLADVLSRIAVVAIDSVGVVVARSKVSLESVAGIVPAQDVFFSAVTRDVVPDGQRRAFTFHFRPGLSRDSRIARIAEVLRVQTTDFETVVEKSTVLPSPRLGHDALVQEIDRLISSTALCVLGNYFEGLAIEDCVSRARSEFARLGAAASST